MLSSDESKAGGKSNQRKGKPQQAGKKERNRKAAAPQDAGLQRLPDAVEESSTSFSPAEDSAAPDAVVETAPNQPAHAETLPVDYRTLVNAYGDYSRTSLEQTRSFFEQLAGVRSFDKALELQTAFAQQAYENFAAQSEKIRELHREMARQRWQRLEGLVTGMTRAR